MIEHVYRRTSDARSIARVIVATDDRRIADAVRAFGGEVQMTSEAHPSGTDAEIVINVQGDEPLMDPRMIDEAVAPFALDPALEMSTLRKRIEAEADRHNPNITKVVVDEDGFALYFSRAPIPFTRDGCPPAPAWRHIGLYVYRRDTLLRLAALPPVAIERAEALEQLRALAHGIAIQCVETTRDAIGVDTPSDLEHVRALVAAHPVVSAS